MKLSSISSYRFTPNLPDSLSRLTELAYNYYWSWRPEIHALFRKLEPDIWHASHHNPVKLLMDIP